MIKKHLQLTALILLAALLAGCTKEMRKARHQERADTYFAAGNYSGAEVEYMNVLQADRLNTRAIAQLGTIYSQQGRTARAYPFLMKAHELDPANIEVSVKASLFNLMVGNLKQARAGAETILAKSPSNADAPLILARSAITITNIQEVRERLHSLGRQTGDTAPINLGLGLLLLREGDSKGARAAFIKAVALDPKSSAAHTSLGTLFWAQNDLTNAEVELKAAADLSPPRAGPRLDYAVFKLKTGRLEEGRALLTQITKETPDALPAWLGLAEVALMQNQTNDFETFIRQALNRDPDGYEGLLLNARQKLATGDYDQAVIELERMNKLYTRSAAARYYLAVAYASKGDALKALNCLNEALEFEPNLDDAILLQAELNIRRDNATAAVTALTQLIKRRPQLAQAYLLLGDLYKSKGDLPEALATYRRLAGLNPKNPQILSLLGEILQLQNKPEEARAAFSQSFALDDGYVPALEKLINLDLSDKKYEAALRRIQAEVEKKPQSPPLQMLLAQVYLAQQDHEKAESALQKALALDSNFQPAYLMLAQLYTATKRNEAALEQLNEAAAKNPREISILLLQGMLQAKQQNFSAARDAYEKLLAINPNFSPALNNVAYLYSEKFNQPDKAYNAASKARELLPQDPATADTLGWVLYKRGEHTAALNLLQESAEKLPDEPEVQFHLGMTYYMLDDEEHAQKTLNQALASGKDFTGKEEAVRCLALLVLDPKTAGPETVASVEARLREHPGDPVALNRLAEIYDRQGASEKAAQAYEQALKQNPKNARWLNQLAKLYAGPLHNPQKALALAKEARKQAPDDADISYTLGRLAYATGDFKWALNLLQLSAPKQPRNPELLYDLALALYGVGRVSEATTSLQTALQQKPDLARATAAKQMLDLIAAASQPETALATEPQAQQLLRADPANVPALMVVAAAAEKRGDPEAAASACELALNRFPDFIPAIKRLAILNTDKPGYEQKVYDWAMKAHESLPDDLEISRTLGLITYRRGDFRSAARFLTESTRAGLADGKSLFYLGMAQFRLKSYKESKVALQRALALNLPADLADEAKKTLPQLK